ncbi:MAG TPA: hypothetical protein VE263_19075 [Candidatus Angelobacter sp.]|nr:hypothetical protein [Candidatus Angelobacter sp.]
MAFTLILILLGAGIGGLGSGLMVWYLVVTRPFRRVRSLLAIGFGYIFFLGSSVGSILLMNEVLEWMGVARHSSQRDVTIYAYTASFVCGIFLAVRGEVRWRTSVGLDDKSLISK